MIARADSGGTLLILDFDGVICDSVPECFVSSWYAFHKIIRGEPPSSVSIVDYKGFTLLRPYIRSGEDYLLIHDLIRRGQVVSDQAGFDARLAEAGGQRMSEYRSALYETREHLLAHDPEYWYSLNPVYPHVRPLLVRLVAERGVYILSTKRAAFILRILETSGVVFPASRIIHSGSRPKEGAIRELLERDRAARAVFVDDQVDHFRGSSGWAADRPIACRLATWGYVLPSWLRPSPDYELLEPEGLAPLLRPFMV